MTDPRQTALERAAERIAAARKAIVLTGAGVSTESGIPDFRSAGGLWSRYDPGEYATLGAFRRDPAKVWHMLAELEQVLEAEPNAGHVALARLEHEGALAGVITQNIDGLHQVAGSREVVEYHGSSRTLTCLGCGVQFTRAEARAMPRAEDSPMPMPEPCRKPAPEGWGRRCVLKPDVVFFDELIPRAAQLGAARLVEGADLVLVAGTGCDVYPVADVPHQVRRQGGGVIEVNLEPAEDLAPDVCLQGRFGEILPRLYEAWRARMA